MSNDSTYLDWYNAAILFKMILVLDCVSSKFAVIHHNCECRGSTSLFTCIEQYKFVFFHSEVSYPSIQSDPIHDRKSRFTSKALSCASFLCIHYVNHSSESSSFQVQAKYLPLGDFTKFDIAILNPRFRTNSIT